MPVEELTTVQDVAEDFTEVSATTTGLIDDYNIAHDDIVDYEITPFGQNKFLVTIIYLFRVSMYFWVTAGLKNVLAHLVAYSRKNSVSVALKVKALARLLAIVRAFSPAVALKNILVRNIYVRRAHAAVTVGLKVALANFELLCLAPKIAKTALKVVDLTRLWTNNTKLSTLAGLKVKQIQAWYNGMPVEED